MKNSKLISILASLSKQELSEFIRYMGTDFFNRKEVLRTYLQYIADYIRGNSELPDQTQLFLKLSSPNQGSIESVELEKFSQKVRKRMHNLTYELRGHLEDYLVWKTNQQKGPDRELSLLKAFRKRGINVAFHDQFRKMDRLLDRNFRNNRDYHWYKYELNIHGYQSRTASKSPLKDLEISNAIVHLDAFFALTKLVESWVVLMREIKLSEPPLIEGLEEALHLADNSPFRDDFIIRSYRLAVRDLIESGLKKERVIALFKDLQEHLPHLELDVAFGIFSMISNYLILIREFQGVYMPIERFRIMRFGLENGLIYRGKVISFATFSNLVNMALVVGEMEWAEQFILKYQENLLPELKEATISISMARLRFRQKNYPATLDILKIKQVIASPFQKLIVKVLRLQCFYELDEYDLLENDLEAGRKFAERNQEVGQKYTDKFGRFLQLLRQLYLAKLANEISTSLIEILNDNRNLLSGEWLQEKAKELQELKG